MPNDRQAHLWKQVSNGNGHWIHHNSGTGSGVDAIGVGLGEDTLGPFPSKKLARQVSDALNNAYCAGFRVAGNACHQAIKEMYGG